MSSCLKHIAPKKFCCRHTLRTGCISIAVIMSIVSLICVIVLLLDLFHYRQTKNCSESLLHSLYSYCFNAIVYCACMFFVHIWLIWGVLRKKSSVVLSWVVITTMWWLQGSCFLFALLGINIFDKGLTWIAGLCFAIVGSLIIAYFILVGYGYWLQLKRRVIVHNVVPTETA